MSLVNISTLLLRSPRRLVSQNASEMTSPLALSQWKQAKYRLTHLGIKELDDLMENYTERYERVFAEPAADERLARVRATWFAQRLADLTELSEIDTQELWSFVFNNGTLEKKWRSNQALLALLAHLQETSRETPAAATCNSAACGSTCTSCT